MPSLTKRPLHRHDIDLLVRRGLGSHARLADYAELTGGTFNTAYLVAVTDGRRVVLKVAPTPGLPLLTHEVDLMRTEADFYRRAAGAGVPVPAVLHGDFSRRVIDCDHVFLSVLPGTPLHRVAGTLPAGDLTSLRHQAAAFAARLHTVVGPSFGYPLRGSRSWQPSWRGAFGAMVEDLVADADRLTRPGPGRDAITDLPVPPQRIGELVRRHADTLDAVDRPALVHFDLWDGNVMVDQLTCGGWTVTGLIDGERAFFGDPLAELVSLCLFREVTDADDVLAGYAAGGGRLVLDDAARLRLTLYTVYLYLIMVIEGATRGYDTDEHRRFRRWLLPRLDELLRRL